MMGSFRLQWKPSFLNDNTKDMDWFQLKLYWNTGQFSSSRNSYILDLGLNDTRGIVLYLLLMRCGHMESKVV